MSTPEQPIELSKAPTKEDFHTSGFNPENELSKHDQDGLETVVEDVLPIEAMKVDQHGIGNLLEAAFVDPAYTWPPEEGQGKNAIELQASLSLIQDDISINTTESMKERMVMPVQPKTKKWWQCCRSSDAVILQTYETQKANAIAAREEYHQIKQNKRKEMEREMRKKDRYNRVPEGILIYRLDTSSHKLTLMSSPHDKTNLETLIQEIVVTKVSPSPDKSRRGIILTDSVGHVHTLIACEQRTATAWIEAINLMLAKGLNKGFFGGKKKSTSQWSKEGLNDDELTVVEDQYMDLANYSNRLIRAGALPGGKKGSGGAGGIYYSIEPINSTPRSKMEMEALEAIAKRRAVIKDSWDFFRMICSLLRDRSKYDEVFQKMKLDPVYPYLSSMVGLNDPGDTGDENIDKPLAQKEEESFKSMSQSQVALALVNQAQEALPSLVEICKALAGSLGLDEVGVGPVKDVASALRKADKKYDGDLLKVTDYCRALLVVKDFPSLLALLELARDSFGPLIRRVKLSTLKDDRNAKPGGYRDCIINVELKSHICEIQVHLWPMWRVCGVDGFRHYRHCLEYSTDTFEDAYEALDGLDRKTMAELIVMAEEAVADSPLDNLEWYHEKHILDYFAEAGLFMKHGLALWAEITFRHLIRLRTESPEMGPNHHETIRLYKYLATSLRAQQKLNEAEEVMEKVKSYEEAKQAAHKEAEQSMWDQLMNAPTEAYDLIMDPNRKEREEEEKLKEEIKASKKHWRKIRRERFAFLDTDASVSTKNKNSTSEEKKQDEPVLRQFK